MKKVILLFLIATGVISLFYNYRLYRIDGNSMNYGLAEGDIILSYRHFDTIERGDLVVFGLSGDPEGQLFIKRCAAVPGDRFFQKDRSFYLQLDSDSDKTDQIAGSHDLELVSTENGHFIKDPYLKYYGVVHNWNLVGPNVLNMIPFTTLEEGLYYMLGDYRDNSTDSRFFGAVPRERIFSKVLYLFKKPRSWRELISIKEVD